MALSLLVIGCPVGPDYKRPEIPQTGAFKSGPSADGSARIAPTWWHRYDDPTLEWLIVTATMSNQTLKQAVARVDEARAQARIAGSFLAPTITANPSYTYQRPSQNRANSSSGGPVGSTTTSSNWAVPAVLSYEVDVWGRVRRSLESARADAVATAYDEASVRLTVQTDVAQFYYALRLLDAELEIFDETVTSYREQVRVLSVQLENGLIDPLVVAQSRAQLEATVAQKRNVQRARANQEHALAIICGQPPTSFTLRPEPSLALTPPQVPVALPATLLRRRPDVASAEQRVVAANARIGVAMAEFYPSFTLVSSAGFESANLNSLFDWQSRLFAIVPGVSVPIFEGGRLKANLEVARAQYRQLVAAYVDQVLVAYGDVEDALTDVRALREIDGSLREAVKASEEYLRFAKVQYKFGLVDYLSIVDAERTLLANRLSFAQNVNLQMSASIRLIKAFGGGWEAKS